MDKNELILALQELDAQLSSVCDVALVGGAAMILHHGAQKIQYFLQEQGWEIE
jgi:hypothetical protein